MAEYLKYGVYVEEFDESAKIIHGCNTSIAGFIGLAQRGPVIGTPKLTTSFSQYLDIFGGYLKNDITNRYLTYGVQQFFENGGSACYVMRVASTQDTYAHLELGNEGANLIVNANNPGEWGNECFIKIEIEQICKTTIIEEMLDTERRIHVENSVGFVVGDLVEITGSQGNEYNRIVSICDREIQLEKNLQMYSTNGKIAGNVYLCRVGFVIHAQYENVVETYHVSLNQQASDYIRKVVAQGILITCEFEGNHSSDEYIEQWVRDIKQSSFQGCLCGGVTIKDESAEVFIGLDAGEGKRTGIASFKDIDDVCIMVMPGVCDVRVQQALIAHCEEMKNRFAILNMPKHIRTMEEMIQYRDHFNSSYAALYHPWLQLYDALYNKNEYFPPSASIAGVYARVDHTRGVHKAPANETLKCTGLSISYTEAEQGKVNPKGVNLIRSFAGQGIRVWGARTCTNEGDMKYIHVKRTLQYIEQSIMSGTTWVTYEVNNLFLWMKVQASIRGFLSTLWRSGALTGTCEEEAFFINIGPITMSQEDIDNGRLHIEVGVSLSRPSEFTIIHITQHTQNY